MVKSKHGFTMLELLMVVIVVGILASLAIPKYKSFSERARMAEAKTMIGAIKNAQELYYLENESYGLDAQIKGEYVDYPTAGNTTLWTYTILPLPVTSLYVVIVTRTTKDGGNGSDSGHYVYNRATGTESWGGIFA